MTTTILSTSQTTAFKLTGKKSIFAQLEDTSIVVSSGAYAFDANGVLGANIRIDGTIIGANDGMRITLGPSDITPSTPTNLQTQNLEIGQQGRVLGLDSVAIQQSGSYFNFVNHGEVSGSAIGVNSFSQFGQFSNYGTIEGGMWLRGEFGVSNNITLVNNLGTISGIDALQIDDSRLILKNAGTISGIRRGILIDQGTGATAGHLIENSGEIVGKITISSGNLDFENSGNILGDIRAGGNINHFHNSGTLIGSYLGEGTYDHVTNSGTIIGNVQLGDGNGQFENKGGSVEGAIFGGKGNDRYAIDRNDLFLIESKNEGVDTVTASISYQLLEEFENLKLAGAADLRGAGNELANEITGNSGNNVLLGLAGNDVIKGGAGDDHLRGGTGKDKLFGDDGDDILRGGAERDTLSGGNDDDILRGGAGNDVLKGGNGDDRLIGNLGKDVMDGGDGLDVFVFNRARDSKNDASADVIKNFESGVDLISLTAITGVTDPFAAALSFQGAGQFTGSFYEVRLKVSGGSTSILVDTDGDKTADMKIIVDGITNLTDLDLIL